MTPVYVMELHTNLQTWKISVTPVDVLKLCLFTNMEDLSDTLDVLKLYLSTNMEDLSDTSRCTEIMIIYKHGRPQ